MKNLREQSKQQYRKLPKYMFWEVRVKKTKEGSPTRSWECKPSLESLGKPVQTDTGMSGTIPEGNHMGMGLLKSDVIKWSSH